MTPNNYERLLEPHRRALTTLELELNFFLRDVQKIDDYSVSSRIKSYDSATRKSQELGIAIDELHDLAGMRVVVGTSSEPPVLERFFTRQELGKDLRIVKRQSIKRENGYRALHLVVELGAHYQRSIYTGRVEVQIQTIFEHAFNFLSRNWLYKQPWSPNSKWKDSFEQLSKALEEADLRATELHRELVDYSADESEASLTPHSLMSLVLNEFGEQIELADAVDACRFYTGIGISTNGQLKVFFCNSDIAELFNFVQANSDNNSAIAHLATLPKNGFWSMFGTRIHVPDTWIFIRKIAGMNND